MGVDLTLVPERWGRMDPLLAEVRLPLDRDYDLQAQIRKCHAWELDAGQSVLWCEEDGLSDLTDDPYGDRLVYTLAGILASVELRGVSTWNAAIMDFMRQIPAKTRVVLWWH